MNFLYFLIRLPFYVLYIIWEASCYFLLFLLILLRALLWLISPLIGDVQWSTPKWYPCVKSYHQKMGQFAYQKRTWIGGLLILSLAAFFIGNYAYNWHLNRPKPIDVAPIVTNTYHAYFYAPSNSNINNANSALVINFSGHSRSPAPLDLIGKTITQGISISPNIEGEWKWQSDRSIRFKPTDNWPLGQKYTIKLDDKTLLAEYNLLSDAAKSYQFTSQDFSYRLISDEFYQDPVDPDQKMAIFTVAFSHPVDKTIFEKNVSLALYEQAQNPRQNATFIKNYPFTITYDNEKNYAYIKSAPLSLPDKQGFVALKIEKGLFSTLGGSKSTLQLTTDVTVPGRLSLFVGDVDVALIEVNNKQINQLLTITLNDSVKAQDLLKAVKVWQLPERKQPYLVRYYDQLENRYKNKIELTRQELSVAKVIPLTLIASEQPNQRTISLELSAEQGSKLYIEVASWLTSVGSYRLASEYQNIISVPQYPVIMNFAAQGSLLSLSGDRKLPIVSRNMDNLKLEIKRVIPSQLQHLVAFNDNSYEQMNFGELSSANFVENFSVEQIINGNPSEVKYSDVDLTRFLKADTKGDEIRGIFLVHLYGNKTGERNDDGSPYYRFYGSRFIVITDLGIISKKSLDQSYDIFAQSIQTGQPIANAKVAVVGLNGIEIAVEQTDDNGHVHFAPLADYYQGIRPLYFVVEKDQDVSFLPIQSYDRQLNFSRFDIGGDYETIDGGELRSHLFSDRGVYRPGDLFHIGSIVRAQDWSKSLAGIPLEIDIYDAKSNLVQNKTIILDEFGFNEVAYQTDYTSPTGEWYVNLYLKHPKEDYRTFLGSTSVTIREFEPDSTTVSLTLLPDSRGGWVDPKFLTAQVTANNLFGTPAQDRRVESSLILEPSVPYFSQYDSYHFYQYINNYRNSFNIAVEANQTDENGVANIELPIQSFEGNYTARVLVDVFEPGSGRSVSATGSVFVSRAPYLVGAKTDGSLSYIKRDTQRNLNLIAINPQLEQISLSDLTLVVLEQKYLSVLVKQPSGVYKYESKPKEVELSQTPFAIDKQTSNYALATNEPGNYIVQIKNDLGDIIYQTSYSVAGTANVSRNLDRNAELVLKIDNNQYKAGDKIEISINAPYVGSGLITIERDKVYAWQWFSTDTTSSVQTITVPEGIDGNAYINVQFVRSPSSDEIFMSPLSYGVVAFKIANDKFNDHITLSAPSLVKPGATLPITLTTNSPQRAIIFAVDEGILQVAGYKLQNPLNNFLRKRALSVRTAQLLDLILPEYSRLLSLSAPGGDADESLAELSAHLNPFKRKVDAPIVYWSGIIDVDGEVTVDYTVPDYFNGKIRIMAISVGKNTMGSTQTATTVRNDFVLSPNVPYFVAPGDEFEISLSVANNLEATDSSNSSTLMPIMINLTTTDNLVIVDAAQKTIDLASMKEGTLTFKLKATAQLGNADFVFTATSGNHQTMRQVSTSVRPATVYRLQTVMGRMDGSKQTFTDFRAMYQPYSQREAMVSYSPFVLAKGLSTYLADFPHYCSEQIISRAVPILVANKYPEFNLALDESTTPLAALFQTLQSRQNSDGAIGLWYSTYNVDPFVTLYTVNFLLEAKDAGQAVPLKLLQQANRYVTQIAKSTSVDEYGLRLRAYAVYLLTRQNQVTTNYIAAIMSDLSSKKANKNWQTDLTALYLAASYKMLKMDKEADTLLKPVWNSLSKAYNNAWWTQNYYDPLVIDAGKIYLISRNFPEKAQDIPAQALENLVIILNQQRYTTQSSAMTIMALDSYVGSINRSDLTDDSLMISAQTQIDKEQKLKTISKLSGILAKSQFTANDNAIILTNNSKLPAWYQVSQQGFDKVIATQALNKGIEIYREFSDQAGQPISDVMLGDLINVTIRVRALSKEGATNLAIIDLLPGGFEVVQQPVSNQTNPEDGDDESTTNEYHQWRSPIAVGHYSWYPDYTDVREDRVNIYGSLYDDRTKTFIYQLKATNIGQYIVPSAYAEALYNRDIQAMSKGGELMTILPK